MLSSFGRIRVTVLSLIIICLVSHTTATADDWADLTGRFVYDGDPPAAAKINPTKDVDFCGKFDLKSETLVVGEDKGLANIAIWVRTKKVKVHPDFKESAKAQIVLDNKDCRFGPHMTAIRTGQTLRLKNSDIVAHNSQGYTSANPEFNFNLPPGSHQDVVFKKKERRAVQIKCSIHPWMVSYLIVQDNPYSTVSAEDGTFRIEKLPAGTDIEFQAWTEAGWVSDVKVKGGPWKKGKFKLTLKPGETDLGDILVNPSLFN